MSRELARVAHQLVQHRFDIRAVIADEHHQQAVFTAHRVQRIALVVGADQIESRRASSEVAERWSCRHEPFLQRSMWQNASVLPAPKPTRMTAIHLTVHENAADFLAAAGAFLNLSEAENSIVSISAARMVSGPTGDDADAYLATVEHQGAVAATSAGAHALAATGRARFAARLAGRVH